MEQIIKGNKSIAEFRGCKPRTYWVGGEETHGYGFDDTHITEYWHENDFVSRTPYHQDWNLLMDVVEKIEQIGFSVVTEGSVCLIYNLSKGYNESAREDSKIKSTWIAVVDFIQWYNENKK